MKNLSCNSFTSKSVHSRQSSEITKHKLTGGGPRYCWGLYGRGGGAQLCCCCCCWACDNVGIGEDGPVFGGTGGGPFPLTGGPYGLGS